ncbi:hypothetical protein ABPG72_009101 [Tetrahymena utriculariae]
MNNKSTRLKRIGDKMEFDMEYNLQSGKIIGQGSFGSVYKCVSSEDNQEWAIKIIEVVDREEYKGSAEHEMNIFLQMDSHPNIIGIKRIYTWTNDITHKFSAVIVQELADKGLYDEYQQRRKANAIFTEDEIMTYLKQCVDGLYFIMLKNGIYHRDIKTENILLKNNQIKITDFGVSKNIQAEKIRTLQSNTITGTPLFLSPKLWEGYIKRSEFNVQHDLQKSDIFSLGLVFLQLTLLLSNQEMAGLNQPEGDKKLIPLLNRIRSMKLRTILAAMLAFEEKTRADYATIVNYFSMKEIDFSNGIINQYLPNILPKLQQPPIFAYNNNAPQVNVANAQGGYRLYGQNIASPKNTCSKHCKEIEYFCEYENCFEGLCSECRAIHTPSHKSKIMAYSLAVSKYIDQNILSQSYMKMNSTLNNEIKGKVGKYLITFREEMQKACQEIKKQINQSLETTVNKWQQEIESKLQSNGRDAELAYLQIKTDERILQENQQKFKSCPTNYFYLQMIAKQQQQLESNLSSASEKVQRIQSDIQNMSKIESMYLNTMNLSYTFAKNLTQQFDQFFSELILQTSEKPIQQSYNPVSSSKVIQVKGNIASHSQPNEHGILNGNPKSSNCLNVQTPSNLNVSGEPIRNRSSDTGQSIANKFSNFFNGVTGQKPSNEPYTASKEAGSPQNSKFFKSAHQNEVIEFTPLHPTKQYYVTTSQLQDLIFIEQTKQKRILLTSQSDGKIIKINLQNEEKSEVSIPNLAPRCTLLWPSTKRIICGTNDGKIFLFDPINMKMIDHHFKDSQNTAIINMTLFEKKLQLLTGSVDGQVALWNLEKKIIERVYQKLHQGEIRGIITNNNDQHMITVSTDKSIIITEIMTNKTIFTKNNAHTMSIVALKKIKENSFFTAGADGYVKLWEWVGLENDLKQVGENRVHNAPITFLDYYPKYNLIVTSSSDGVIHFTDPSNYSQIASTQAKPLKGGAKGIYWQKPCLYTVDSNNIQKWDNEKFVSNLAVLKKRVKSQNSNCNIF